MALLGLAFAGYFPALNGEFLWDDRTWLTDDDAVALLGDIHGLWRMWSEFGALQHYFPLTGTSFWIDHHLWGAWTLPYHIENVILHVLSALLFWRLLRVLEVPGSWFAAALFTVHPVMVESVAWITERKNVLSMPLFLGALLAWRPYAFGSVNYLRWRYVLALVLFVLGLLAKSSVVVLPAAFVLLTWWKRGRIAWRTDGLAVLPFVLMALVSGVLTVWLEHSSVGAGGPQWQWPWSQRLIIAGRALYEYARLLLWPVECSAMYPRWTVDSSHWQDRMYPAIAIVALGSMLLLLRRQAPGVVVAVLFFVAALFPMLGFFYVYGMNHSFIADRWVYLASLPVFALLGVGMHWMTTSAKSPSVAWGICLVIIGCLVTQTNRSSSRFTNEIQLWQTTLDVHPGIGAAQVGLGMALNKAGRLDEALASYRRALALHSDDASIMNSIANILLRKGNVEDAMNMLRQALAVSPERAEAHNSLGICLFQTQRFDEAVKHYQEALKVNPDYVEARCNMGNALQQLGRLEEAVDAYVKVLKLQPDMVAAHGNLAVAYANLNRPNDAIDELKQALRLKPDFADALNNLQTMLRRTGRESELPSFLDEINRLISQ